jgi:hypothetical protein
MSRSHGREHDAQLHGCHQAGSLVSRALFTANLWTMAPVDLLLRLQRGGQVVTERIAYDDLEHEKIASTDIPVLSWRRLSKVAR